MAERAVFLFARCPEHGLHGERDDCFVCSGPVEHVPMVTAEQFRRVQAQRDELRQVIKDHRATVVTSWDARAEKDPANHALWSAVDEMAATQAGGR